MKLADEGWMSDINKPRGLMHIDIFLKGSMKKGIVHIELPKGPIIGDSKRQNSSNGRGFNHGTKCFKVIKPLLLMKAFGN